MRRRGPRWRRARMSGMGGRPEDFSVPSSPEEEPDLSAREHRRLRLRRRGRRAYIRSVYFLPSMATLGNAVCGFGAIYIAATASADFSLAAYLVFAAMIFDALDGRLARFARHTTDFGGQLDSLADIISFGAAPAMVALRLLKMQGPNFDSRIAQLIWAIGALYLSCAAIRLARFNVSNQHGEQHHFSFLGLPSPGAAGAVAALILMQQQLARDNLVLLSQISLGFLPFVLLGCGLLMISQIRYPHLVNRYLRGKRSIGRLILVLSLVLLLVVAHQYTLGVGTLTYAAWGPIAWIIWRVRRMLVRPITPTPGAEKSA